jgi:nucleotide-binding universal stress UspA family protein
MPEKKDPRARGRSSRRKFRIVVASDGSPQARAAVAAAVAFPWPDHTQASAVVASGAARGRWSTAVAGGVRAALLGVAADTDRELRRRWPEAVAEVVDDAAAEAILATARGARVIVVGSHGYSRLERWTLGSVSRAVVRRAATSVLVVRGAPTAFREIVVGYDGSNHARRAMDLLAACAVPPRGRVTACSFVEPVEPQPPAMLPRGIRNVLAAEAKAFNEARLAKARRALERAVRPLAAAGWRVRLDVRVGVAARDLPGLPTKLRADLLVIGAQGTGWKRLLLGSVVETVLDRGSVSTLIVR